jgi:hypothetical protein
MKLEDKQKIRVAFRELRKRGYVARMNFMCCLGCGCAALPKGATKWVFYHQQDAEGASLWIAWGGDASEICAVLRSVGLTVVEPPDENTRIEVLESAMLPAPSAAEAVSK